MSYVSKYFQPHEYECRCGCGGRPDDATLKIADELRAGWGQPVCCSSGYRCEAYALYLRAHGVPAAVHSAHNEGKAMDLTVEIGRTKAFQGYVRGRLTELDIYMEAPEHTPSWTHIQTRPIAGGRRIFEP